MEPVHFFQEVSSDGDRESQKEFDNFVSSQNNENEHFIRNNNISQPSDYFLINKPQYKSKEFIDNILSGKIFPLNRGQKIYEDLESFFNDLGVKISKVTLKKLKIFFIQPGRSEYLEKLKYFIKKEIPLEYTKPFLSMIYMKTYIFFDNLDDSKKVIEKSLKLGIFKALSTLQSKHGMPTLQDLEKLIDWCTIDGRFNASLFAKASRKYSKKGLLKIEWQDVENLKNSSMIDKKSSNK